MIWRLIKHNIFGNLFRPLQTKDILKASSLITPTISKTRSFTLNCKINSEQYVMSVCSSTCIITETNVSVEVLQLTYYTQFDYILKPNNTEMWDLYITKDFRQLHHHNSFNEYLFTLLNCILCFWTCSL
jgi:hypothetical protein